MQLKDFNLLKEIGRGATAKVFLAENRETKEQVSLKIFHPKLFQDPEVSLRIYREAETALALKHPHIVEVKQVIETEESPILVMDYISGENLSTIHQRLPYFFPEISLLIAIPILKALEYAHAQNLIHRDLKPENILVDASGQVFLTDFGLAKNLESTTLTQANQILGSIDYMSPEQTIGARVEPASDLFSFSSILYFLVTGLKPFRRANYFDTLKAIRESTPEKPSLLNPKISPQLEQLILVGLHKNPEKRIQSAKEYRELFEAYLVELGLDAPAFSLKNYFSDSRFSQEFLEIVCSRLSDQIGKLQREGNSESAAALLQHLKLKDPYHHDIEKYSAQNKNRKKFFTSALAFALLLTLTGLGWRLYQPQAPIGKPSISAPPAQIQRPAIPMVVEITKEFGRVRFELADEIEALWNGTRVDPTKILQAEQGTHQLTLKKSGYPPIQSRVKVSGKKEVLIKAKG